jgi:O-acetyl-ADP-ribose deacetylase (regulator of RNase III)
MTVDAIVNAANTALQEGGGVCGAIFSAAGARELQAACDKLAPIETGGAVITSGFKLPAKYVIHAAGPIYRGGKHGEETQLRGAYVNSLRLAVENGCESVAFPLISSGIYGYPKADALRVATDAIRDFLRENDLDVYLAVFDRAAFTVSESLIGAVQSYIDEHYVEERRDLRRVLPDFERDSLGADEKSIVSVNYPAQQMAESVAAPQNLADIVGHLDEPFSETLLRLIDASGRTDAEVYKRANIDRRLFSKIRGNAHYAPSKQTVLAFAVALELTLPQTADLLERAGFALSHSRKFDVIVEYFIAGGRYDVFEINEVLFSYDQALLGG